MTETFEEEGEKMYVGRCWHVHDRVPALHDAHCPEELFVAMQAQINELEAARDALTADREAFILQLQKIKVLPE